MLAALFYGGYGFILLPTLNIAEPYGGSASPEYNNAFGFYILSKSPRISIRLF